MIRVVKRGKADKKGKVLCTLPFRSRYLEDFLICKDLSGVGNGSKKYLSGSLSQVCTLSVESDVLTQIYKQVTVFKRWIRIVYFYVHTIPPCSLTVNMSAKADMNPASRLKGASLEFVRCKLSIEDMKRRIYRC